VDQAHIQDVLAAFTNSKLRFQITQVHWDHFQGSIKPVVGAGRENGSAPAPGSPLTMTTPRAPSNKFGMGAGRMPAGGDNDRAMRPPAMADRGGAADMGKMMRNMMGGMAGAQMLNGADAAAEEPANLVQLGIYGIASLYQRFPPKDAAAADAAAPK
jgi:hypothetical protein